VTIGEYVGGKAVDNPTVKEKYCIDMIDEGRPIWLRPSYDGLRFEVSRGGIVRDNGYHGDVSESGLQGAQVLVVAVLSLVVGLWMYCS